MTTSRADMTDLVKRLRYADHDADKRNAADAIEAERLKRQQAEHERHCILEDLAGAEKDAKRYRWLRGLNHEQYGRSNLMCGMFNEELDAAIDAAIAQEAKP